jgi:ribonuclease P/MRP protein subunit RPP1
MFYDLKIEWPQSPSTYQTFESTTKKGKGKQVTNSAQTALKPFKDLTVREKDDLRALLRDAEELGFSTVALNFDIVGRIDGQQHAVPLSDAKLSLVEFDLAAGPSSRLRQLSRMTLVLDETSMGKQGHGLTTTNQSALLSYDLLAVKPFNDVSFSAACLSMTELKPISIDIISLDVASSARPSFFMRRTLVNSAISNGAVFEICYGKALTSGSDDPKHEASTTLKARRNIISATRELLRVTNGRNVILSSGASDLLGIRGPYDVINLATIFGMNATAARDAISSTCRALVIRAETRKTYRGVVSDKVRLTTMPNLTRASPPLVANPKKRKEVTEAPSSDKQTKKIRGQ